MLSVSIIIALILCCVPLAWIARKMGLPDPVALVIGGAALENVSKRVGLDGTRREVVVAYAAEAKTEPGERLASLGALAHRLERGIRLM